MVEAVMAPADRAARPHGLSTLLLCAAAALVEGFDNQSMGVAAPRVIAEFGLSPAWAGLVFSSATFGLFLGAALGGRIADYIGRKRALIASLLLFGLFSLLTAVASGAATLSAARLSPVSDLAVRCPISYPCPRRRLIRGSV
jgi:AAHS family 3-hydroxyphenylpropionic acid transporter